MGRLSLVSYDVYVYVTLENAQQHLIKASILHSHSAVTACTNPINVDKSVDPILWCCIPHEGQMGWVPR